MCSRHEARSWLDLEAITKKRTSCACLDDGGVGAREAAVGVHVEDSYLSPYTQNTEKNCKNNNERLIPSRSRPPKTIDASTNTTTHTRRRMHAASQRANGVDRWLVVDRGTQRRGWRTSGRVVRQLLSLQWCLKTKQHKHERSALDSRNSDRPSTQGGARYDSVMWGRLCNLSDVACWRKECTENRRKRHWSHPGQGHLVTILTLTSQSNISVHRIKVQVHQVLHVKICDQCLQKYAASEIK